MKKVRIIDDDKPPDKFAVAFSGASWTDPDSIALTVIVHVSFFSFSFSMRLRMVYCCPLFWVFNLFFIYSFLKTCVHIVKIWDWDEAFSHTVYFMS